MSEKTNFPSAYTFNFSKQSSYKDKSLASFNSKGKLNFQRQETDIENVFEYIFKSIEYQQDNNNSPLLFSPVKCLYDQNKNDFEIKNKDNFKLVWERYRDKHRNKNNQVLILSLERLYFHTDKGIEFDVLSNAPYLPFFIPQPAKLEKESILPSINWLFIPLNLPLKTTYKCQEINDDIIYLKGWVSLDEESLDSLMTKDNFKLRAKDYHFSRDFQINSDLKIKLNTKTQLLYKAEYEIRITGENNLKEITRYSLYSESHQEERGIYKTHKGKNYTKEEWAKFEQEQWDKYNKNNRSFLAD